MKLHLAFAFLGLVVICNASFLDKTASHVKWDLRSQTQTGNQGLDGGLAAKVAGVSGFAQCEFFQYLAFDHFVELSESTTFEQRWEDATFLYIWFNLETFDDVPAAAVFVRDACNMLWEKRNETLTEEDRMWYQCGLLEMKKAIFSLILDDAPTKFVDQYYRLSSGCEAEFPTYEDDGSGSGEGGPNGGSEEPPTKRKLEQILQKLDKLIH